MIRRRRLTLTPGPDKILPDPEDPSLPQVAPTQPTPTAPIPPRDPPATGPFTPSPTPATPPFPAPDEPDSDAPDADDPDAADPNSADPDAADPDSDPGSADPDSADPASVDSDHGPAIEPPRRDDRDPRSTAPHRDLDHRDPRSSFTNPAARSSRPPVTRPPGPGWIVAASPLDRAAAAVLGDLHLELRTREPDESAELPTLVTRGDDQVGAPLPRAVWMRTDDDDRLLHHGARDNLWTLQRAHQRTLARQGPDLRSPGS